MLVLAHRTAQIVPVANTMVMAGLTTPYHDGLGWPLFPEILGETRTYASRLSGYLIGPRFWATAFTLCPGLASYIGSVWWTTCALPFTM